MPVDDDNAMEMEEEEELEDEPEPAPRLRSTITSDKKQKVGPLSAIQLAQYPRSSLAFVRKRTRGQGSEPAADGDLSGAPGCPFPWGHPTWLRSASSVTATLLPHTLLALRLAQNSGMEYFQYPSAVQTEIPCPLPAS